MAKRWQFRTVKGRLTFWFLLVTLVALLVVCGLVLQQQVAAIKQEEFAKLKAVRDLKAGQLEQWLRERVGDVRTLSQDLEIRELERVFGPRVVTEQKDAVLADSRGLLQRYLVNYDAYNELFILHPETGVIVVSTEKDTEGMDKSGKPYFQQPLQTRQPFIQDVYFSRHLKTPAMAVAAPIFCLAHQKHHIVGILVARVDLQGSLYPLLEDRIGLGETGETLIVNKEGLALSNLRWQKQAPLNLHIQARPATLGSAGRTGIIETEDYRPEKVLAAYTTITPPGWGFVAKQDLDEVYAPIRGLLRHAALLLVVAGGLVYLLAAAIAAGISRPIQQVGRVSARIEAGDLAARNEITTRCEIGELARAFNTMAEAVEKEITVQKFHTELTRIMLAADQLERFRKSLLHKLMEITGAQLGVYYQADPADGEQLVPLASTGMESDRLQAFDAAGLEGQLGRVITDREMVHLTDLPEDAFFTFKTFAGSAVPREMLSIPLRIQEEVVAVVCLGTLYSFTEESLEAIRRTRPAMDMGLSDLKAAEETRRLSEKLAEQNQELQAQAEELQQQSEELQQQNLKLEAQRSQVEEANRLKSEFLSNMSHELRTPLNSVMALSRVLKMQAEKKLSEEEAHYLEIIERNGRNLLELINDILDLSKIESGRMDLTPVSFSFRSLAESIMERLEPLAAEKGLVLRTDIPADLPPLESDEARVRQILQNLAGNAVKFTTQGEVALSVRVEKENIAITVRDTGVGIPAEELPHIFERFRQVDGSSSRKYEGTGLGLSIAAKTAEMLGGSLRAESREKEGATFTLTLPLKWPGQEPLAIREIHHPAGGPLQGRSLLLVEDNPVVVLQMKIILEKEGYGVTVANDGQAALDAMATARPDGIILDLMMPGVDGYTVLKRLRRQPATARIPVLILTAKDLSAEDRQRLQANNVRYLLQKGDVDREELLRQVERMLGSSGERASSEATGAFSPPADSAGKASVRNWEHRSGADHSGSFRRGAVILVVEDNPDGLTTIRAVLGEDFSLLEAPDGETGLELARQEKPDLVLLDIGLPGMDGLEVVRKLRENASTSGLPVIALTARAMKGDREKVLAAGCDDYLAKPLDPAVLRQTIARWL